MNFQNLQETREIDSSPTFTKIQARISIEFNEMVWIEDLKEICEKALKTETQVIVKREDEMVFAELNGAYLKFVEDARLLYDS